ncbi:hypothetical protein [Mesorhizobium loti]|uniref:hypothetical protein n=1 Tax=Rhizobium loti TaxID=381 RepID=UPI0012BBBD7F|nr:hypothetical protein [Mesorhizobium loti]
MSRSTGRLQGRDELGCFFPMPRHIRTGSSPVLTRRPAGRLRAAAREHVPKQHRGERHSMRRFRLILVGAIEMCDPENRLGSLIPNNGFAPRFGHSACLGPCRKADVSTKTLADFCQLINGELQAFVELSTIISSEAG